MAHEGEFEDPIRRLGQCVAQFDQLPESPARDAGRELVQLLMEVHGAGLERMMEIIFESGEPAQRIIDQLGKDSLVGSLLLLYSLHPDPLDMRVQRAVDHLRPRLRKLSCAIELVQVQEGAVQLRLAVAGHSCGSSARDLRSMVEEGVYELAPDVSALEIQGLEEPAPTGFVSLASLMGHPLTAATANRPLREAEGAD